MSFGSPRKNESLALLTTYPGLANFLREASLLLRWLVFICISFRRVRMSSWSVGLCVAVALASRVFGVASSSPSMTIMSLLMCLTLVLVTVPVVLLLPLMETPRVVPLLLL